MGEEVINTTTLKIVESEQSPQQNEKEDFPSMEEINRVLQQRREDKMKACAEELTALMKKYNARLEPRITFMGNQITDHGVAIVINE